MAGGDCQPGGSPYGPPSTPKGRPLRERPPPSRPKGLQGPRQLPCDGGPARPPGFGAGWEADPVSPAGFPEAPLAEGPPRPERSLAGRALLPREAPFRPQPNLGRGGAGPGGAAQPSRGGPGAAAAASFSRRRSRVAKAGEEKAARRCAARGEPARRLDFNPTRLRPLLARRSPREAGWLADVVTAAGASARRRKSEEKKGKSGMAPKPPSSRGGVLLAEEGSAGMGPWASVRLPGPEDPLFPPGSSERTQPGAFISEGGRDPLGLL